MITTLVVIFALGYVCIALEHKLRVNKAAIALLMFGVMWSVYSIFSGDPNIGKELIEYLGDTSEILFFLIGAMTIVEIIDTHGGFDLIIEKIHSRSKVHLLWTLVALTFVMSAVLDNMTTSIIMVVLLRKIIKDQHERWMFIGAVILSANSGGAWSPIGDITTIMLWMRSNVTTFELIRQLLLPCIISVIVPTLFIARYVRRNFNDAVAEPPSPDGSVSRKMKLTIFVCGVLSLLAVPIFKHYTHLPPYVGMMVGLGFMWVITEIIYDKQRGADEESQNRVSRVIHFIDMPTIIFFLGILMSVSALQCAGVLGDVAQFLDKNVHEVFSISTTIGILSAVVDNVPLVAASMGMYPIADPATVAAAADPAYTQAFVQDGLFWHLLAYCAGVGGSLLIIGSAAGVVAMGLDKISFGWYLKRISLYALLGYLAGVITIYIEHLIF